MPSPPPAATPFDPAEVADLPPRSRRYLLHAIAPGVVPPTRVHLRMRGTLRVGERWLRFRGEESLDPHGSLEWRARFLAGLLRVRDRYQAGRGSVRPSVLGLIPLGAAGGEDVDRSARARAAGEAFWCPTALLPRFGVSWRDSAEDTATASWSVDGHPQEVQLRIGPAGEASAVWFERWGNPDATSWRVLPFGGLLSEERTFAGITIPTRVRGGWWFDAAAGGGERFAREGEFFRARVTSARFA